MILSTTQIHKVRLSAEGTIVNPQYIELLFVGCVVLNRFVHVVLSKTHREFYENVAALATLVIFV